MKFSRRLVPLILAASFLEMGRALSISSNRSAASSTTADFKLFSRVNKEDRAYPAKGDYNPETVIWPGTSSIPVSFEAVIALTWVCMVASMPLVIMKLEGKLITKSQYIVFAIMWTVFLGGVVLFTKVISFQSSHFDTVRSLTIVESVYLLSQILTTVGYGDITPATQTSQVFVAFYAVFSLVVIANVVAEVSKLIQDRGEQFIKEQTVEVVRKLSSAGILDSEEALTQAQDSACSEFFTKTPVALDYSKVMKSGCAYVLFVSMGCCFFHNFPGEEKTWFEGVYMSIITLSTIGFGAITPSTEAGKVFAAFWMLFGSAALVALVSALVDLYEQMKLRDRWNPDEIAKEEALFLHELPEELDERDFLKRALIYKQLVEKSQIESIENFWLKLVSDREEKVTKLKLKGIFDRGNSPKQTKLGSRQSDLARSSTFNV